MIWLLTAVITCRAFPEETFFLIILLFRVTLMLESVDNTEEKLMLLMRLLPTYVLTLLSQLVS